MSYAPSERDRMVAAQELVRLVTTGDSLSEMERDVLGHGGVRLHIDLRDPVHVKEVVVPVLRQLANDLAIAADIRGPALHALFSARLHIRKANGKLKSKPHRNNR